MKVFAKLHNFPDDLLPLVELSPEQLDKMERGVVGVPIYFARVPGLDPGISEMKFWPDRNVAYCEIVELPE